MATQQHAAGHRLGMAPLSNGRSRLDNRRSSGATDHQVASACMPQDAIELRSKGWVRRRAADGPKKIEEVHQADSWGWLLTCCMCAAGHDRAAVEGLGAAASCRWAQEDRGGAPGRQLGMAADLLHVCCRTRSSCGRRAGCSGELQMGPRRSRRCTRRPSGSSWHSGLPRRPRAAAVSAAARSRSPPAPTCELPLCLFLVGEAHPSYACWGAEALHGYGTSRQHFQALSGSTGQQLAGVVFQKGPPSRRRSCGSEPVHQGVEWVMTGRAVTEVHPVKAVRPEVLQCLNILRSWPTSAFYL